MKLYRNIIIITIVVAVLGGAMYFVSKYLPENDNSANVTQQPAEDDMFSIYKGNSENVSRIQIKNADEEYAVSLSGETWVMNGDSTIRLKQTNVKSLLYTCTSVSVKKTVSETSEKAADFGFSAPTGYAELFFNDGTTKRITVGNKTLDGQDYYIMVSDDEKIYLKNTYGSESLIPSSQSLRDLSLISVDSSDLSTLKHVYMSKQGNTAVKLENTNIGTSENPNYQWRMLEPVFAEMNGQVFTDKIISCFEAFQAAAVVEDHPDNLSTYGLDAPYAEFSVGTADKTLNMKVGGETDTYRFLMEEGYDTVYAVPKSSLTFLDVAYVDLMSNLIHVEYISNVDKVAVVSGNTKYDMEIKGEKGAEEYYINGVKIQKETFSKAYQAVIGISLDSLDLTKEPTVTPAAYIKYTKKDGSTTLVEFLPVDERNYRVTVDGKGSSITNKKNFEGVLSKLEETVKGAN